jgi:cytochrome c oxidase cbb3-type subunit 3/ubiquinol-cytochrome c reductase cytochrome c subunit
MKLLRSCIVGLLWATAVGLAGCRNPPGKPQDNSETKRPDQILDFPTLYAKNCAGCHGESGRGGAAISLANPVYLSVAGVANIERVTANGVSGTMMPPFARSVGGLLTDEQIGILSQGMVAAWGKPSPFDIHGAPSYSAAAPGDAAKGESAFSTHCASCHGSDGKGAANGNRPTGSLVDPAYVALISDQGLRSILIAGDPEEGMPDWHSYSKGPLTDPDIANIVAWLASKRVDTPGQPYRGQPYRQHP